MDIYTDYNTTESAIQSLLAERAALDGMKEISFNTPNCDLRSLVGFSNQHLGNVKRINLKLSGCLFALFAISFMVFRLFSSFSNPYMAPSQPSASKFTILEYVFEAVIFVQVLVCVRHLVYLSQVAQSQHQA